MNLSNEIKCIVFDLDGTLFNSQKKIFKENIDAIIDCHRKGLTVAIATARPLGFINHSLPSELTSVCWKICHNGAQLFSPDNTTIYKQEIDLEVLIDLVTFIERDYHSVSWYQDSQWYCTSAIDEFLLGIYGIDKNYPVPLVKPIDDLLGRSSEKVLIVDFKHISELRNRFKEKLAINITKDNSLVMISAANTSKKNSVMTLLSKNGLNWQNLMVFGDDHNDLCLFEMPCFSVAMGNALAELKDLASVVTGDHDVPSSISDILHSLKAEKV